MFSHPIAVADTESCGKMFLSSITAGKSLNNFGDARPSDDPLWNATIPQGSVSMSLDRFSEQTGIVPHHIKIDVDGIEPLIIARSEEQPSELQSLMHNSYVVFRL